MFNLIIIRVDQRATIEFTSQAPISAVSMSRSHWTTPRFVRHPTVFDTSDTTGETSTAESGVLEEKTGPDVKTD